MGIRQGLPYGWYKNPDVWAGSIGLAVLGLLVLIVCGWLYV